MTLIFEQIHTGGDRNFGYLLADSKAQLGLLIDPSYAPEKLVERAEAQSITLTYLLNTHGHGDHTNGNAQAQAITGAKVAAHPSLHPDYPIDGGKTVSFGAFHLEVLSAEGHTPDHLLFYEPTFGLLFTGDHLFVGKIGGTASEATARQQYEAFRRHLTLPSTTTVWPGHDYGARPSSTLALESATNPFLQAPDFEAFCRLKQEWPSYKASHGLL